MQSYHFAQHEGLWGVGGWGGGTNHSCFTPKGPSFHQIGDWMHPRASHGVLEMGKSLARARARIK
jgi:hypothetical protein